MHPATNNDSMSGGDCSNEEKVTVAYYAHASHRTKQVHSELHSPDNKNNKEMSTVSKKKKKKAQRAGWDTKPQFYI